VFSHEKYDTSLMELLRLYHGFSRTNSAAGDSMKPFPFASSTLSRLFCRNAPTAETLAHPPHHTKGLDKIHPSFRVCADPEKRLQAMTKADAGPFNCNSSEFDSNALPPLAFNPSTCLDSTISTSPRIATLIRNTIPKQRF
jgi:hypothetical protein